MTEIQKTAQNLFNADCEKAILVSIMGRPGAIGEVKRDLEPEALYHPALRMIYQEMLNLDADGHEIDRVSLGNRLNGNTEAITQLEQITERAIRAISYGIKYHVQQVSECHERRSVHDLLANMQKVLIEGVPANDAILDLKARLGELQNKLASCQDSGLMTANELLNLEFEKKQSVIGQGVLEKNGSMIIAGESGIGKSLLVLNLAYHLVMGWHIWDLEVPTSQRVLIVQFENPQKSMQDRLKSMLTGSGIASFPNKLKFSDPKLRFDLKLKTDRQRLQNKVKDSDCDVIIYDPLGSLSSYDENKNDQMRACLDSLTEINYNADVSSIVVDHFGKPNIESQTNLAQRLRGATAKKDWVDTLICLTRYPHEHRTLRQLNYEKVRNGPDRKPVILERDQFFNHEVTEEDMICPPHRVREILEATFDGECEGQKALMEAIVTETGCKERSARNYIRYALEKGEITKEGEGRGKGKKIIYWPG